MKGSLERFSGVLGIKSLIEVEGLFTNRVLTSEMKVYNREGEYRFGRI